MNPADAVPFVLLILFGAALGLGLTQVILTRRWSRIYRRSLADAPSARLLKPDAAEREWFVARPTRWLAVFGCDAAVALAALGANRSRPCLWADRLARNDQLIASAPVKGWVIVTGESLPDPTEDVDLLFRFLTELSGRLGRVQYFQADPVLNRHAWVQVQDGEVRRAYAWAEHTLWNQGRLTVTEKKLGMTCVDYGAAPELRDWSATRDVPSNEEKVPLLAALWSVDPVELDDHLPCHAADATRRRGWIAS